MALSWFIFLSLFSILLAGQYSDAQYDNRKAYIVYMGDKEQIEPSTSAPLHMSMLQKVAGSNVAPGSLLRSYRRSFSGFVARLTEKEAQQMA
ncbi:Subtilase, partial [Trema orientale]